MGKNSVKKRIECLEEWLKIERGVDPSQDTRVKTRKNYKKRKFVSKRRK